MRTTLWLTVAALLAAARLAAAQELELKFATLDAPTAHHTVAIHIPWAEKLNAEAKGVFKVDMRHGMTVANHGNVYSRALDDVTQIAWGLQGYATGKFPLSEVVTLPLLAEKSEYASVALWRLYKSGLLDSEYDEIVAFKLIVFPQSGLQFRSPPKALDSLSGLKMIAGTKTTAAMVEVMGGVPISLRVNEIYEGLQRGTADGVMIGWTAFQPFKLAEVTKYHVEMALGGTPGMVFIAKKKYQSLPAEARRILDANATEKESREFGQFWDRIHFGTGQSVRGLEGHTVVRPSPEIVAKWRERILPLRAAWAKSHTGGEKILTAYQALLADVEAGR
jgi:TRAP-type C4-dicarboxylate transport system substrate-binding protein